MKQPNTNTTKSKVEEDKQPEKAKVTKTYTRRFYMMILSGVAIAFGVALFVVYYLTLNIAVGLLGAVVTVVGVFTLRHYWGKEGNITVERIDGKKRDTQSNSLNLYPDRIEFGNVYEPGGFPWECGNDKKKYFVNIWDQATNRLVPFILPDQQYCDPMVFAQRVLGLPAHRKIFERKPKLLQKLKTALLVIAIGIVWLLILTTTGG